MKNEKPRGTMLVSTALILCCMTFAAGFAGGSLVADYRSSLWPAPAAPAAKPAQPAAKPAAAAKHEAGESPDQHIAHLRAEAESAPADAARWIRLGNACYDAGRHDASIEAYRKALELAPGNADVITDMGSMYRMKGQPAQAIACYEDAIRHRPGHVNAVFNKGVTLLLDMAQPEKAMAFWESVLAERPDFALGNGAPLSRVMLELAVDGGIQHEKTGHPEVALRAYSEALRLAPSDLPALVHKAWLLDGLKRGGEALPLWQKVLELSPEATDPAGKPVRDRVRQ